MSLRISHVAGEISGITGHEFFRIRRDVSSKGFVLYAGGDKGELEFLLSADSNGWVHLTPVSAVPAAGIQKL